MTAASLQKIDLHGTRLTRYLSGMAVLNKDFLPANLSERLGRLLDIGASMRLAALHDELGGMIFEPGAAAADTAREEALRVRMSLMRSVVGSFSQAAGPARIKLPSLETGVPLEKLASFEPYHHFYAAHQREFASRIQTLQLGVRDAVGAVSAELAQLAALDEAIRDGLATYAQQNLVHIPQLLARRFDFLLQEHQSRQGEQDMAGTVAQSDEDILKTWTGPTGWLGRFFEEMQGLLLAELELRLLPVQGLIEAVNEQAGIRK